MRKTQVAVLGATGMIGQRFVEMLEDHPTFEIEGLYASERSEGKRLSDVLKVRDHEFKQETLDIKIKNADPKDIAKKVRVAFVGLPSDIAGPTETELAANGVAVFTNAGAHRMDPDTPILIPEVNQDHLMSVKDQSTFSNGGFIVTNANCSSTGVAVPLYPINEEFVLKEVFISTYQALSGAGYPGVPSLDAVGNVIPYIGGEEEKMESELAKILGIYQNKKFIPAKFRTYANCARVPVVDGHLESLILRTEKEASVEDIIRVLENFRGEPQRRKLPSAPFQPIIVRREENRPQPATDVFAGGTGRSKGMAVTVGRVRKKDDCIKLFLLSHNTLRGGAGGSMLNAELAQSKGLL